MTITSKPPLRRRFLQITLAFLAVLFLIFNAIAWLHAWSITHYAPVNARTTRALEIQTFSDKAWLLLHGPTIRRMANTITPAQYQLPYSTVTFPGSAGARLEAWRIPGQPGRPSVLMFPGFGGSKDTLLHAAVEFHQAGCETWLVDFSGVGDSEGNTTTVGWREAEDVGAAVRATQDQRTGPLVLYGTSMGASAILCAEHRGFVKPDAIIAECPFDRLTTPIGNRLEQFGIPKFPLAQAIAFWVGIQNGFNGLAHNPVDYARDVRCPVLLMQGDHDQLMGATAVHSIAGALGERGTLKILPNCGHSCLCQDGEPLWRSEVREFLAKKVPGNANTVTARKVARSRMGPM